MARDPVCGMYVDEEKATLMYTVDEITYYFCSKSCLLIFSKPEITYKRIKFFTYLSFSLGILVVILEYFISFNFLLPNLVWLLILSTPIQFGAGYYFYVGMKDAIKSKQANMDTLIAIGTTAAWLYSTIYTFQSLNILPVILPKSASGVYFTESSLIIAFILLGKLIEHNIRRRANKAISYLNELLPKKARVIRNGEEIEVPAEKVKKNEIVLVKPGEYTPVDGIIIEGFSTVDQSAITGESLPVDKRPGDFVYASTINKNGYLKIRALKIGKNTTISDVIEMVEKAILSRAPIQRLADKISSYFVPAVIAIAVFSFLFWYLVVGLPINFALLALISVLIIACPCALGIATPAAILIGASKSAQKGILIKGGEYLEKAYKIDTIVFDKTKTLTKGTIILKKIYTFEGYSEDEALKFASIAEKLSEHPFSKVLIDEAKKRNLEIPDPDKFEYFPGEGIKAVYNGHLILIGNRSLMEKNRINLTNITPILEGLEAEGNTVLILSIDSKLVSLFAITDEIRGEAKYVIDYLKNKGIKVVMITGDNNRVAAAIAKKLGIDEYYAEVKPQDKAEIIKELKKKGRVVAMVGDGINDAPALSIADIGIAIGAGSDIAKEAGGIILINNDLKSVIHAIEISKKTYSKIKQNLFWAFFYNVILIPIAAGALYPFFGIMLNPIFAAIAMASSSITVVTNSLTLNRYRFEYV
jgi:copper-(or silver)-translocating P-type ATPase